MLAIAIATLVLAAPAPGTPVRAEAQVCRNLAPAELRGRVDVLLRSIDVAIAPDEWRALGPAAGPVLAGIADDAGVLPTRRARALWGLVHLSGKDAAPALARHALEEAAPLPLRLAAVRGLAAVSTGDRAEATLRPVLEAALDARVRAVAAEQLVEKTAGASCAVVRAQVEHETSVGRALLAKALGACAGR